MAAGGETAVIKGMTTGETMHKFIVRKIRPDTKYMDRCNDIVDKLVRFLERKDSRALMFDIDEKKINVKRIFKVYMCVYFPTRAGLKGRGRQSDIDLIIFLNGFSSVRELVEHVLIVLRRIKTYVEEDANWSKTLIFKGMISCSVQFCLKIEGDDVDHKVDLLPAVDITESMSKTEIYEQIKDTEDIVMTFSASLSPFQMKFTMTAKVKDLIRVLKYWAKVESVPLISYFFELLVIAHWRENRKSGNFDINLYFKQIMEQLTKLETLAITFDDNYQYRLYTGSTLKAPYLLNPVNPYNNVAPCLADVPLITQKAKEVLQRLG